MSRSIRVAWHYLLRRQSLETGEVKAFSLAFRRKMFDLMGEDIKNPAILSLRHVCERSSR